MANRAMGIGVIGGNDVTFKRQFRFTFQIQGFCNNTKNLVPEYFVKTAKRPSLTIEETEINFLNAKTWIPGKASWETITVSYVDVAHIEMAPLWNWLATVYNFTDPIGLSQGDKIDWNSTGILAMYDGCGVLLEQWELQHMWPQSIDFGELAYANSEEATIDLTLRYSDVIYTSYCPAYTPNPCCTGCTGGSTSDGTVTATGSVG